MPINNQAYVDKHVHTCVSNLLNMLANTGDYPPINMLRNYSIDKYHYWLISGALATKLKNEGEAIIDFEDLAIWIRSSELGSLYLDPLLNKIIHENQL